MSHLLRTSDNRLGYWLAGSLLLWLWLPSMYLDMMFASEWYAPNFECDSAGPLLMELNVLLLPWAALAAAISAIIVFAVVRKRESGVPVFTARIGSKVKNLIVTVVLAVAIVPFLFGVAQYLWDIIIPHTVSGDCGGRAELVTRHIRRSFFQTSPFIEVMLMFWFLHIRTLLLSKRLS